MTSDASDGKRKWSKNAVSVLKLLCLAVGCLINFTNGSLMIFSVYQNAIKQIFNYTQSEVGLLSSMLNVGIGIGLPAGMLFDRWGAFVPNVIGLLVTPTAYLLIWSTTRYTEFYRGKSWLFSFYYFLAGHGTLYTLSASLNSNVVNFHPSKRGKIIGLMNAFFSVSPLMFAMVYTHIFINGHVYDEENQDYAGYVMFLGCIFGATNLVGLLFSRVYETNYKYGSSGNAERLKEGRSLEADGKLSKEGRFGEKDYELVKTPTNGAGDHFRNCCGDGNDSATAPGHDVVRGETGMELDARGGSEEESKAGGRDEGMGRPSSCGDDAGSVNPSQDELHASGITGSGEGISNTEDKNDKTLQWESETNKGNEADEERFSETKNEKFEENNGKVLKERIFEIASRRPCLKENYSMLELLGDLQFQLVLWLFNFFSSAGMVFANNVTVVTKSAHMKEHEHFLVLLAPMASTLICLVMGPLSDLLEKRGVGREILLPVIAVFGFVEHLIPILFPYSVTAFTLDNIVAGFVGGSLWSVMMTLVSEIFGLTHYGRNWGFFLVSSAFFSMAVQFFFGKLYDMQLNLEHSIDCFGAQCFRWGFVVNTGLTVLSMLLAVLLVVRTRKERRRNLAISGSS